MSLRIDAEKAFLLVTILLYFTKKVNTFFDYFLTKPPTFYTSAEKNKKIFSQAVYSPERLVKNCGLLYNNRDKF